MLDYKHIQNYRENNRVEAKKAVGGLPHSIWETYSAFANTIGGVILLGVEENMKDHTLHPIDLPHAQEMVEQFWNMVNDPKKASVNILTSKDVQIIDADNCRIIAITVPRAMRQDRPVYVDGDPIKGTYRRNGEGDYHCDRETVEAMLRDAQTKAQDLQTFEQLDISALDLDSLRGYRVRMKGKRPGHALESLNDEEFLLGLGAMAPGEDGRAHPTAAGLLMFGREYEIVRCFPSYSLEYIERMGEDGAITDRIDSGAGSWSGNLYDFYVRVYERLNREVRPPQLPEEGGRVGERPVHAALREALSNCLINADYRAEIGVRVVRTRRGVIFTNPGGFRVAVEKAKVGGVSDPRNATLMRLFSMINVSSRTGSGLSNIYAAWKKYGWAEPILREEFAPDRITIALGFVEPEGAPNAAVRSGEELMRIRREEVIHYLTLGVSATSAELARALNLPREEVRGLLRRLIKEGLVVGKGPNRVRRYQLRA